MFPIVPPLIFSFPFNSPPAKLMPTRNPIVPNLSNQFQFPINYMYGSNIDPMGRMSAPWSMMGGKYVLGSHTHTIIIAPSIVGTPMISVCRTRKRVSILVPMMPRWINSNKD